MESSTIRLLKGAGQQGILLAELAQQLDQTESALLPIVDSLSKNGQVKKIEETHNGQSVVRVIWQDARKSEWDTLEGCPCFVCSEIDQCGASQPISPLGCEQLNKWIKERVS